MSEDRNCAALILSHGRPDHVRTYGLLKRSGWTRPIYIVVDDQDKTLPQYQANFGKQNVIVFNKTAIAENVDTGDQGQDLASVLFARNAAWGIAKDLGLEYFLELDDDYSTFRYRHDTNNKTTPIRSLDLLTDAIMDFLDVTNAKAVAMSQGGDHMGGFVGQAFRMGIKRKAMNAFFLKTDRQFDWYGILNDDVNTYVVHGGKGELFMSIMHLQLEQTPTQAQKGGLTDLYLRHGTYVKSFYTVMMAPSCTVVSSMGVTDRRMHHRVAWDRAVPKIISDKYCKSEV